MFVDAQQRVSRPGRSPIYTRPRAKTSAFSRGQVQSLWIVIGLVFAFGIPFAFADLAGMRRDAYYAIYVVSVVGFLAL